MRLAYWLGAWALVATGCRWIIGLDDLSGGGSSSTTIDGTGGPGGGGRGSGGGKGGSSGATATGGTGGSNMGGSSMDSGDAPIDGKLVDALPDAPPDGPLLVRQATPPLGGIAVFGDDLFWVQKGSMGGGVFRGPKDGDSGSFTIVFTNQNNDQAFDVAADASAVYWSNGSGVVVFRRGTAPDAGSQAYFPGADFAGYVAVDEMFRVYVTSPSNVVLGPPSTLLFGSQPGASGIAVFGDQVFWGWGDGSRGGIRQATVGGSSWSDPVSDSSRVQGIAMDGVNLYWINDGGEIKAVQLASMSAPRVLCAAPDVDAGAETSADVAVDGQWVYFTQPTLGRINKCAKK